MRYTLIPIICALLFISCSTELPTTDQIQTLIAAIPDHGIKESSDDCFTTEYFSLLEHAWAIPSDAIGEIGSDEWLYYFISGNDTPDNIPPATITAIKPSLSGVEVIFNYLDMEHHMELVHEKGKWLIADYDDTREQLRRYIDKQREYFKSEEWKQYLNNTRKEYSAEAADDAEEIVKEYFRRYR